MSFSELLGENGANYRDVFVLGKVEGEAGGDRKALADTEAILQAQAQKGSGLAIIDLHSRRGEELQFLPRVPVE